MKANKKKRVYARKHYTLNTKGNIVPMIVYREKLSDFRRFLIHLLDWQPKWVRDERKVIRRKFMRDRAYRAVADDRRLRAMNGRCEARQWYVAQDWEACNG